MRCYLVRGMNGMPIRCDLAWSVSVVREKVYPRDNTMDREGSRTLEKKNFPSNKLGYVKFYQKYLSLGYFDGTSV